MYICEFLVPRETKRNHQMPWDPVTNGCEPPYGCWVSNPGPLEEHTVLVTTEPGPESLLFNHMKIDVKMIH